MSSLEVKDQDQSVSSYDCVTLWNICASVRSTVIRHHSLACSYVSHSSLCYKAIIIELAIITKINVV